MRKRGKNSKKKFEKENQIGYMLSNNIIDLASLTGYLLPFTFTIKDLPNSKTAGSYKFMRQFSNQNPSKVFAQFTSDVNDKFSDRVTQCDLENYLCEKNRDLDDRGKHSSRRKKDCIFYDISSNQIQFFSEFIRNK